VVQGADSVGRLPAAERTHIMALPFLLILDSFARRRLLGSKLKSPGRTERRIICRCAPHGRPSRPTRAGAAAAGRTALAWPPSRRLSPTIFNALLQVARIRSSRLCSATAFRSLNTADNHRDGWRPVAACGLPARRPDAPPARRPRPLCVAVPSGPLDSRRYAKVQQLTFRCPPRSDVYISSPFGDPDPAKLVKSAIATEQPASPTPGSTAADGEAVSAKQPPSKGLPPRYGWLTVRKTFKPRAQQDKDGASAPGGGGAAGSGPADASTPSTAATYSSLLLRSVRSSSSKEPAGGSSGKDGASASQPAHSYAPPPEFFYAALKGSILYLYTSEALDECHAVLDLQQHDVTFYPVDGLLDGELFAKRNAIHLKPRKRASASSTERSTGSGQGGGDGASAEGESSTADKRERSPASSSLLHPSAWFIFVQSNTEMEECVAEIAARRRASVLPAAARERHRRLTSHWPALALQLVPRPQTCVVRGPVRRAARQLDLGLLSAGPSHPSFTARQALLTLPGTCAHRTWST